MANYINKDETIKAVREQYLTCDTDTDYNRGIQQGFDFAMSIICRQPTADVVEVVRCKDCKYYFIGNCMNTDVPIYADNGAEFMPDSDFYCSLAERKEAEE